MRRALADLPLPRIGDGSIALVVNVSNWLRPEADTALTGSSATSTDGAPTAAANS